MRTTVDGAGTDIASKPKPGRRRSLALAGVALVLIFAALRSFAGRGLIQDLIFVFYMLALAQCWNLLAGYAGLDLGRAAGVCRARRLSAVCADDRAPASIRLQRWCCRG